MESAATEYIRTASGYGPEWFFGLSLLAIVAVLGVWGMKILSKRMERQLDIEEQRLLKQQEIEQKREARKQEETQARIQHDREMAEIKGQMVEAIHESNSNTEKSNALMESLKVLMESVVSSNNVLHEDIKASQAGSRQMQGDMKDVKNKVDLIYAKEF